MRGNRREPDFVLAGTGAIEMYQSFICRIALTSFLLVVISPFGHGDEPRLKPSENKKSLTNQVDSRASTTQPTTASALAVPSDLLCTAQETTNETTWTRLFNGENLSGWMIKCRPADKDKVDYWKVRDGAITAETPPGSDHHYIWLLTEREYGDFELRLKVQTYGSTTGNSGIQVRSRYDDANGWLHGPQVDIHPPGPWRCGFIYDETRGVQVWLWPDVGAPANAQPSHAPANWRWFHADDKDVWNDVKIICRGTNIKTLVNGIPVADYDGAGRLDDQVHRKQRVGLKGHIGLQIHPGQVLRIRFKDIEIRELGQ
jgi:hypothetical protein